MMRFIFIVVFAWMVTLVSMSPAQETEQSTTSSPSISSASWHLNYSQAVEAARQDKRLLLIQFHSAVETDLDREVSTYLADEILSGSRAHHFTLARLSVDYASRDSDPPTKLLQHPSFAELGNRPGLAIIDFSDPSRRTFHYVVSIFPLTKSTSTLARDLSVLVDLPAGTLEQRTLIFAVRTHAESPESAGGEFHPILVSEADSHSSHQANINLQGHHNWDARFQRINTQLSGGLLAQEVCAESWPGQGLFEAARECVHSWRQSPGHWEAVKTRHPVFGYSMKRGSNGVWYATGIFGKH